MTTPSFCFCIFIFLSLLLLSPNLGGITGTVNAEMSWCVAKPSASEEELQANLDYACSQAGVDCSPLRLGLCHLPDIKAHYASFAMNLYYQAHAREPHTCNFRNTALLASSNPTSNNNCTYIGGDAQIPAGKTWCVAKPATYEYTLKEIITKICGSQHCEAIEPGGPCYTPNNLWNHASVAMNLLYINSSDHKCDFLDAGLLVVTDPSHGSCNMQGKQ